MDPKLAQLVIASTGLIGAAGDFSNKIKGLVRETGSLPDPSLQKDLQDVIKFATECTVLLSTVGNKS